MIAEPENWSETLKCLRYAGEVETCILAYLSHFSIEFFCHLACFTLGSMWRDPAVPVGDPPELPEESESGKAEDFHAIFRQMQADEIQL